MPIVQVSLLSGRSPEQKADLARRITDAACQALEVKPESVRVLLTEVAPEEWFVGGRSMAERRAPPA